MKRVILGLLSFLLIASCTDDQITKTPNGSLNPENFWQTSDQVWKAVNNVYGQIPESSWNVSIECGTDNATSHHHDWDAAPWVYVLRDEINSASSGVGGLYNYTSIRAMNYVLENLEMLDDEIVDANLKARYVAEVRAMRAWTYMILTSYYGDVPLVTTLLTAEEAAVERTPKAEVRKFVIDELTAAAAVLPVNYEGGYTKETGRIDKGTALTLKARAALYFGDYATAEAAAKAVMNLNKYALFTVSSLTASQQLEIDMLSQFVKFDDLNGTTKEDFARGIFSYRSIWYENNASVDNPEYIFTEQHIPGNQTFFSYVPHWIIPRVIFQGDFGWASFCPTQKLVNSYWLADGKTKANVKSYQQRATEFAALKAQTDAPKDVEGADAEKTLYETGVVDNDAFMSEFNFRDSRFYATIGFPFAPSPEMKEFGKDKNNVYEWDRGFNGRGITGYYFKKLWDPNLSKDPVYNYYGSFFGDFPLIRYAEVLLIYAEARTHNVGFDGEVQNALNQLRHRAGMPNVPTSLSGTAALDFIHNERRIELAGEGHRYFDVRRYEAENPSYLDAASAVQNEDVYDCNNSNVVKMRWSDRLMYLPISQQALDFNQNLEQNSGY